MTTDNGGLTPDPAKEATKRETRDVVRIVVAVALLVLLIAFVLLNSQQVTVHFIVFKSRVALIWVLLVTALLGALVDRLWIWRQRNRQQNAAKKAGGS